MITLPRSVFHDIEDATTKASFTRKERFRSLLSADYVFVAAIAIIIGCNCYFGPRIKRERIAMQRGSDGKPTWHAPRWVALWWMIPFMIAARCIIWLASTYAPQSVHGAELGIVLFSVIGVTSHIFVLTAAEKAE